jgi:hypothetical protein
MGRWFLSYVGAASILFCNIVDQIRPLFLSKDFVDPANEPSHLMLEINSAIKIYSGAIGDVAYFWWKLQSALPPNTEIAQLSSLAAALWPLAINVRANPRIF